MPNKIECCEKCGGADTYLVSDRWLCESCGVSKMKEIVRARLNFLGYHALYEGAYVRVRYRVGPKYPDARRRGRILQIMLKDGVEEWRPGGRVEPRAEFLVRAEDGHCSLEAPDHLEPTDRPTLILASVGGHKCFIAQSA